MIYGVGFVDAPPQNVMIGSETATNVKVLNDQRLSVTTPPGTGSKDISVVAAGPDERTATLPHAFSYVWPQAIDPSKDAGTPKDPAEGHDGGAIDAATPVAGDVGNDAPGSTGPRQRARGAWLRGRQRAAVERPRHGPRLAMGALALFRRKRRRTAA